MENKIVTLQSPNGETITVTTKANQLMDAGFIETPKDSRGEEYCCVSEGSHNGRPSHVLVAGKLIRAAQGQ